MFVQLAMFAGLAQSGRRDLSEPECGMIMRLRGYVETEDWNSAMALKNQGLRIAKAFESSTWVPEEVGQIYVDLAVAFYSCGKGTEALPYCDKALSIAMRFDYFNLEAQSCAATGFARISMGNHSQAIEWLERAMTLGFSDIDFVVALADAYQVCGDYTRSIDLNRKVLDTSMKVGDKSNELMAQECIGTNFHLMQDHDAAIQAFEKAVRLSLELQSHENEKMNRSALGGSLFCAGQSATAIPQLEKAADMAQSDGDRRSECDILALLGNVLNSLGRFEQSAYVHLKVIDVARDLKDLNAETRAHGNLGIALSTLGRLDEAVEFHDQCLQHARTLGDDSMISSSLCNLGNTFNQIGNYQKAFEYIERSILLAQDKGDHAVEARGYLNMSESFMHMQEYRKAISALEKALPLIKDSGDEVAEAATCVQLGSAYSYRVKQDDCDSRGKSVARAFELFQQCSALATKTSHAAVKHVRLQVFLEMAKLHFLEGQHDDAIKCLAKHLNEVLALGANLCLGCGQVRGEERMPTCSSCKVVRYCNKDHQWRSWRWDHHKIMCPLLRRWRKFDRNLSLGRDSHDSLRQLQLGVLEECCAENLIPSWSLTLEKSLRGNGHTSRAGLGAQIHQ